MMSARRITRVFSVHASLLALALLSAASSSAGGGDPAVSEMAPSRLTFDLVFGPDPSGRSPRHTTWGPDGKRLAYQWEENETTGLWVHDVSTGGRRQVLELGDRAEHGIETASALHWSPDGRGLLVVASDDLYLIDLGSNELRRLTRTEAKEKDPKFSPNGRHIAFVRDDNLVLLEVSSGEERALTTDGSENQILNGTTDWVYWEEIWGRNATGFWWSPQGTHIAYYRFDDRHVKSYPLVDFTTQYPTVEWQKYPKAGEENPIVKVGVLELASGETTWLDTNPDDPDVYLARVDWRPSGDRVAIQRLNRDQDRLDLLLCDPAEGDCSTLHTETSDTWVNVTKDLRFLEDNRFLWTSEKSGWSRLYLYSPEGELVRDLTPEGWTVTRVEALTERGEVVVTGHETTPMGALHSLLFRQPVDGTAAGRLGHDTGWNRALVAPRTGYSVISRSAADQPTERFVVRPDGGLLSRLPSWPPPFDADALPKWKFFSIENPDGDGLPAAMLHPSDFDPGREYPAVMYHYGGPASQVVAERWAGTRGLWHKMLAQRGYVVLMVDNRGSNFFGKHGADLLHRRFGEVNLAAQLAGVSYLESLDYVDTDRIGLWGWSGGGSNTLYSMLNSPGTWQAGVSGAPVTDWHFYDTIWTERYLDHPEDNPDGYHDSSAITYAGELEDELLIVHGTGDDNVHPQNTIAMARKLIDAGVAFEDAIHPRQKHGFRGIDSRHFFERMTEFFDRHLVRSADSE